MSWSGFIETFRQPGVLKAALAYYRTALAPGSLPLSNSARVAARFPVPVPTLAITGVDDACIDSTIFKKLMYPEDFPRGLRVESVPGAGHFPHQEQAEQVNELLLDWFAPARAKLIGGQHE